MDRVTCVAPVNIAVIKYWGKRDEELILPINDSLSVTLSTDDMCAKTTVMASDKFEENKLWLNGCEESMDNPRIQNLLQELMKKAKVPEEMIKRKIHICSVNNFPTAAGLASSAAGYACLAYALAKLFNVEGDISGIARAGSGSACRSVYGGFVRWFMGKKEDGSDSIAKTVFPASHWPELRILILVVNDAKKKVSSSEGMKRTLLTSYFLNYKANSIVPDRVEEMEMAIEFKDFKKFAELTMRDSNEMHAACMAAYPPCIYMNDTSHLIIELVHAYNNACGKIQVAYTFDAGPNATLFLQEGHVPQFVAMVNHFFPNKDEYQYQYQKGIPIEPQQPFPDRLRKMNFVRQPPGKLKYIIQTRVGEGPVQLFGDESHLLNNQGLPVNS